MKKGVIVILIILIVSIIGIGIFFLISQKTTNDMQETVSTENSSGSQTVVNDPPVYGEDAVNITEEESLSPEQTNENYKIFDPVLKYEGSYNGPLYATSEQIGDGYNIDKYMANLDRNGVNFFIGMFPILGEQKENYLVSHSNLGYVVNNVRKYPHRIIPFFNPGFGGEEIEDRKLIGDKLTSLYRNTLSSSNTIAGNNLIKGFGEIETQEWSVRHNDPKILQLTDIASSNKINFMFHPVALKINDVEDLIEKYPDTNFLIHMYREDLDKSEVKLIEMMKNHNNLYFSIDAAHIIHYDENDILYSYGDQYGDNAGKRFISTVNSNYNSILNDAVSDYKPLVNAVPDKVMWGTEAGPEYSFEPEVYDLMIKISREFISKVAEDPAHQEALGYKNALGVFGQGVVLEKEIKVIDSSSWLSCNEEQMDSCDESCGIMNENDIDTNPDLEVCFDTCLTEKQCIDPLD